MASGWAFLLPPKFAVQKAQELSPTSIRSLDQKVLTTITPSSNLHQQHLSESSDSPWNPFTMSHLRRSCGRKTTVLTILDLNSGVFVIDASMGVYGLRPVGNAAVDIGDKKTSVWNLPRGILFFLLTLG